MNLGRHFSAIGAVFVITSAGLHGGPAYAFGDQWRPVAGYPSQQVRDSWRSAQAPAFRPRYPMTSAAHEPPNSRLRQPARYQAAWPAYAAPRYPAAVAMPVPYGHPAQPGYFSAPPGPLPGAAYPGWTPAFGEVTQPWQHPVPMFARQFAWRPAGQLWMVPASDLHPADRGWTAPRRSVFPASAPGYGTAHDSRRPVPGGAPFVADRRYAAPVYSAPQQHGFSGWRPVNRAMVDARPTGWNAAPAGPNGNIWRPQPAVSANGLAPSRGFRPQAYGRSPAPDRRMLARGEAPSGHALSALPGWVTTYEETDYSDTCAWCGGS